jgi:hypothetical protein
LVGAGQYAKEISIQNTEKKFIVITDDEQIQHLA